MPLPYNYFIHELLLFIEANQIRSMDNLEFYKS